MSRNTSARSDPPTAPSAPLPGKPSTSPPNVSNTHESMWAGMETGFSTREQVLVSAAFVAAIVLAAWLFFVA